MRPRTTWNREQIKQSSTKVAEDPRAMNQDHHSQQPKADAYVNGDPSSWAEDIHKPNTWDVEYSGGATKRDEIGMPEKRPETYNHPEKTAAMEEKILTKKADLTVKLAKLMLGNGATEKQVEDQAVALMDMSDQAVVNTYNTLAEKLANQSQFPGGQFPTAEQQAQAQQQQIAQLQQQAQQALQAGDLEQAKQAIEQCMAQQQGGQQQVMAGKKKADESAVPTSAAPVPPAAPAVASPAVPAQAQAPVPTASATGTPDLQTVVNAAVIMALKQAGVLRANDQQQGQQQGGQQGQQTQANQQGMPAQMQTQAEQQAQMMAQQQAQMAQAQQQQMLADDALLDELMMGPGQGGMSEADIELETTPMDVGEVTLGPEDDVLKSLFANEETQAAEQAQQAQGQGEQQKQAMARVASRTMGTRPTGGVSRVGGGFAPPPAASGPRSDIDKLAALWPSAPDVRSVFGVNS